MSEVQNNNYDQVFKAGMTKDEFIAKYKELAAQKPSEEESSVFFDDMTEENIGILFDTIHISKESDNLNESDIQALSSMDGNAENISDEDIKKLYEKIQEACKNTPIVTGPIDSDTKAFTPSEALGHFHVLKLLKMNIAETKKMQIQNEINQLVNNNTNISAELKQEYNEATRQLHDKETELKSKQKEYDNAQDKIQRIKESIARKQGEINGTQDESKKASLQQEINGLNTDLSTAQNSLAPLSTQIESLKTSITTLKSNLDKITDKIEKSDAQTAQKIRDKQTELNKVDTDLNSELDSIDTEMRQAEALQLQAVQQAGSDTSHYSDIANGVVSDGTVGKNAAQALSNAASQIGVREATGHNDGAEIAKYRNGVDNNAAWCASFVSWCYKGNDVFGYQASVSGIQMAAQRKNIYAEKGTYTPKPGDVMIQKNGISHTGIVESVDPDGTIHTIEGNTSNSVARRTYKPGSKGYNHISGWVKMS